VDIFFILILVDAFYVSARAAKCEKSPRCEGGQDISCRRQRTAKPPTQATYGHNAGKRRRVEKKKGRQDGYGEKKNHRHVP
jgi:hypothetical protein